MFKVAGQVVISGHNMSSVEWEKFKTTVIETIQAHDKNAQIFFAQDSRALIRFVIEYLDGIALEKTPMTRLRNELQEIGKEFKSDILLERTIVRNMIRHDN